MEAKTKTLVFNGNSKLYLQQNERDVRDMIELILLDKIYTVTGKELTKVIHRTVGVNSEGRLITRQHKISQAYI